jgi:ATP-dependent Clp protease protease subunit
VTDSPLEKSGVFLFMENFTASSCEKAIRFVLEKNLTKGDERPKSLTFVINSPGGSVPDCFALIDTIKGSKIPVHTVGLGSIASCGLLLFISGKPGHRVITPNTSILSHQYSWGQFGKEHELFATMREFSLLQHRIMEHYKKCTGLKEKVIQEKLLPPEDVWLDSKEAVKLGLADKIVTTY